MQENEEKRKGAKDQLYEGMYIVSAHLTDEARTKTFEKIKNGIVQRGGVIKKIHDQGKRRLAYPIAHNREGCYYIFFFEAEPKVIPELWQEYHLTENLLRFVTRRTNKVLDELKFKQLPEL